MQLSLITELYKSETVEKNLIKNLIYLRSNLKYLRAEIDTWLGYSYQKDQKFLKLAYITNKIGYALYYLAVLGYYHSRELSHYSTISQKEWHDKNRNEGVFSASEPRSLDSLYEISKEVESFLNTLKIAYRKNLESAPISKKLVKYLEESISDLRLELNGLRK